MAKLAHQPAMTGAGNTGGVWWRPHQPAGGNQRSIGYLIGISQPSVAKSAWRKYAKRNRREESKRRRRRNRGAAAA